MIKEKCEIILEVGGFIALSKTNWVQFRQIFIAAYPPPQCEWDYTQLEQEAEIEMKDIVFSDDAEYEKYENEKEGAEIFQQSLVAEMIWASNEHMINARGSGRNRTEAKALLLREEDYSGDF